VLKSTLIRNRSQVKPATLLIPIDLFLLLCGGAFYFNRYQSGSFLLINVGSGFLPPVLFLFFIVLGRQVWFSFVQPCQNVWDLMTSSLQGISKNVCALREWLLVCSIQLP